MTRQFSFPLLKHRFNQPLLTFLSGQIQQYKGVAIAASIILLWIGTLSFAFLVGASALGLWGCFLLTPWLTFLYTGLFVTGHDAMHKSIAPAQPLLNSVLGKLALFLYGLISYEKLHHAHAQHHQHPATHRDPDFHNGRNTHPLLWYFRFMSQYWTLRQTIGLVFIYNSLYRLIGIPEANLLVFWALPSLLSSIQLFYCGTYLVHRKLSDTYCSPLRSNSYYLPWLLSLITCYHFGYHREHHALPHVPWWQLPQVACSADGLAADGLAADHITAVNHRYTNGGSALATIKSPLVQRDRTRLKT